MGKDYRLLGVSKHDVGSDVAVRSDFVYGSKSHRERVSEFIVTVANLAHDGGSGPRNVLVKVYAPFDAEGKVVIDRILRSVKPIVAVTNTTPAAGQTST